MKQKKFNICDVYILLRLVYELQRLLFGEGGLWISRIMLVLFLGISLYYTVYALTKYNLPKYMRGLLVLVIMFTLYGMIPIVSGESFRAREVTIPSYVYLQQIFLSLLPIFPFYVFTRRGLLDLKKLQIWAVLFLVAASLQYYQNRNEMLLAAIQSGSREEEFTNNTGYYFLGIIPLFSFFSNKRLIQYLGLLYAMAFIMMSMKRGAILIAAICVLVFILSTTKKARRGRRIGIIILGIAVIVLGFYLVQYLLENSLYFVSRIDSTLEGDSSSRLSLFTRFWELFSTESNPFVFLFGHGANGTLAILHQYAHNDWLEIAINQGVLGVSIYLIYWICFYRTNRESRFDNEVFLALSLVFITELFKTAFSMSYSDVPIYSSLCLGYCMGLISNKSNYTS